MGNSEWGHFVPYQENVDTALDELRKREFADGQYYKGLGYEEDEVPQSLRELVQRTTYRTHSVLDVSFVVPLPVQQPDPGQRTLFDLPRTPAVQHWPDRQYVDNPANAEVDIAAYGETIYPLAVDQLRSLFGTERPTKWMVIEAHDTLRFNRLPGCFYIIVYQDLGCLDDENAQPEQIFFYGVTGGGP